MILVLQKSVIIVLYIILGIFSLIIGMYFSKIVLGYNSQIQGTVQLAANKDNCVPKGNKFYCVSIISFKYNEVIHYIERDYDSKDNLTAGSPITVYFNTNDPETADVIPDRKNWPIIYMGIIYFDYSIAFSC